MIIHRMNFTIAKNAWIKAKGIKAKYYQKDRDIIRQFDELNLKIYDQTIDFENKKVKKIDSNRLFQMMCSTSHQSKASLVPEYLFKELKSALANYHNPDD